MSATFRREDEALVVSGDLNQASVPGLWPLSPEWLVAPLVRLELAGLNSIDSAGLALLLELEAVAQQQGQALSWQGCPDDLRQLMQLYDLELVEGRLSGA
ncbi:STAS domain-containing protein [Ferrimonas balearica]|uniref:STAS domain-containing protein n=1 Tax=Ferrimonas balearica TaxID=44012 RepID=UPI002D807363|nr:STAS domain-containing protein [Ferrimonas balearica]MBY6095691.1 STAS domain-containing protein [Ferrimonas balearica]